MTLLAALLVGLGAASLARAAPADPVPETLRSFIAAHYPGYHVPSRRQMIRGWARYSKTKVPPYACRGDFNGDGRIDAALILLGSSAWRLVAFHARADGSYDALEPRGLPGIQGEFERENPAQDFRVFTVKKGTRLRVSGSAGIAHKFDSIGLFLIDDPNSGVQFKWVAAPNSRHWDLRRKGFYSPTGFNALTD